MESINEWERKDKYICRETLRNPHLPNSFTEGKSKSRLLAEDHFSFQRAKLEREGKGNFTAEKCGKQPGAQD